MQLGDYLCRLRRVCEELVRAEDLIDTRLVVIVVVQLIRPVKVLLEHFQSSRVTDVSWADFLKVASKKNDMCPKMTLSLTLLYFSYALLQRDIHSMASSSCSWCSCVRLPANCVTGQSGHYHCAGTTKVAVKVTGRNGLSASPSSACDITGLLYALLTGALLSQDTPEARAEIWIRRPRAGERKALKRLRKTERAAAQGRPDRRRWTAVYDGYFN